MLLLKSERRSELRMVIFIVFFACFSMVIKNPAKISPGLIFEGGGGLIFGMICVLRIRGVLIFGGGGGAYYRDFTVYQQKLCFLLAKAKLLNI